jgi:hypothetical protein
MTRDTNLSAEATATTPKGFNFERHVREERAFEFPEGRDFAIELQVEAWIERGVPSPVMPALLRLLRRRCC